MKARLSIVVLSLVFLVGFQGTDTAPFNDSITEDDLRADLFFLASDAMNGRRTDTPENRLAAEYIASRFRRMGLKPASEESFFHTYNLMTSTLGEDNLLQVLDGDNAIQRLRPGQDYYPLNFSGSGRVRGSMVFAGFGIVAPEHSYDDLRGDDVAGKIVLVVDHEPGERDPDSPFDGVVRAEASNSLRKALSAQQRGALAILFVADVHNHEDGNFAGAAANYWQERRFPRYTLADWMEKVRIPAAQISPALAGQLLGRGSRTLAELSASSETAGGVTPVPITGPEVELTTSINRIAIPDRNVIGMIEGSDPEMKDEVVIVCAHYDHNGADGNRIFAGADDDGSGTVGLIEVAEAYAAAARSGRGPRRTVMFAAWNSEERGLLGAWAYTMRPGPSARRHRCCPQHGHDRPQRGGSHRRRRPFPRPRGSDSRIERECHQHSRNDLQRRHEAAGPEREREYRAGTEDALRQQHLEPDAAGATSGHSSRMASRRSSSIPVCIPTTTPPMTVPRGSTIPRWRRLSGSCIR